LHDLDLGAGLDLAACPQIAPYDFPIHLNGDARGFEASSCTTSRSVVPAARKRRTALTVTGTVNSILALTGVCGLL